MPPRALTLTALATLATTAFIMSNATATPTLASVAGHYQECFFEQRLDIARNGRVEMTGVRFAGGDDGLALRSAGSMRADGDRMVLELVPDPRDASSLPDGLAKPRRLLPAVSKGRRYLLDDNALLSLVNHANRFRTRKDNAGCLLRETLPGDDRRIETIWIDVDDVLPPDYRVRLRTTPLSARVTRVLASEALADGPPPAWMPIGPPMPEPASSEPPPPAPRKTTLEIDRGTADGVFVGMELLVRADDDDLYRVTSVEEHRAVLVAATPFHPAAGDEVSSAQPAWRAPRLRPAAASR